MSTCWRKIDWIFRRRTSIELGAAAGSGRGAAPAAAGAAAEGACASAPANVVAASVRGEIGNGVTSPSRLAARLPKTGGFMA